MDLVIESIRPYSFDVLFSPSSWAHDSLTRQFFEMYITMTIGGFLIYFVGSGLDYFLLFDKSWLKHKKILPNQIAREIWSASSGIPFNAFLQTPFLVGDWRGYSKLYNWPSEGGGVAGMLLSAVIFLIWTDCFVYWIHRFLHTFPWLYQNIHKEHHVWIIPTPWASIAFHPIDGWSQSVPYLVFPYFFPVQKVQYLCMFAFVMFWSVSIHDRVNIADNFLVNGASHHDIHHRLFNYNYGQYFTFWDRVGKSHYDPDIHGGDKDAISPGDLDTPQWKDELAKRSAAKNASSNSNNNENKKQK